MKRACRILGHKWPRAIMSDAYTRIGTPTYWTVQSACQRPGCTYIRRAELAGVNPRFGIPWGEAFERDENERPNRTQQMNAMMEQLSGWRSPGSNRPDTRLW